MGLWLSLLHDVGCGVEKGNGTIDDSLGGFWHPGLILGGSTLQSNSVLPKVVP